MPPKKDDATDSPHYPTGRSDWHDDRDLIEGIAATIDRPGSAYDRYQSGVRAFREWVHQFRKRGYDKSPEAVHLGSWLRELLANKDRREGGYNLNTRPLFIPDDLNDVIRRRQREQEHLVAEKVELPPIFLEVLTTDETRALAKKRADSLHEGNLAAYLSSLVEKERKAMQGPSWGIVDLLDDCRLHMTRHNLKFSENYMINETDFWVPKLGLGVEAVLNWSPDNEQRIVGVIGETKFRFQAKHFAIVARNDVPEHQFESMKEIEARKVFENLRILRVNDFGAYLDEILANGK